MIKDEVYSYVHGICNESLSWVTFYKKSLWLKVGPWRNKLKFRDRVQVDRELRSMSTALLQPQVSISRD